MYVLPTYTMNNKADENSEQLLDPSLYRTPSNVGLIKTILSHKVDPNIQNSVGKTPLHLAVLLLNFTGLKRPPKSVALLLSAGAETNKRDNYGATPLHCAVLQNQLKSIKLLLKAKADPNLADNDNNTPLHYAINSNVNTKTVELLLSANADPNLKSIYGNTPLHKATTRSDVRKMVKAAQLLVQYGTQIDSVNNEHYTPLQLLATQQENPFAQKMGRLLVWHYLLLHEFTKLVPAQIVHLLASHIALICAQEPTIWSKRPSPSVPTTLSKKPSTCICM